ncbi:MAG: transcription termination factor NusA [Omnitrophica bacterium RIFCSPLOWO2_12_FULL_50_11]|nr:MAG: transcription termination factor NusA [Omnitrophica bacterium RIFCSPLOWO2_12_FULL_50_11]
MRKEELLDSLQYIEREKGIKKEVLLEALRSALISACRKTFPKSQDIDVQIDDQTADIRLFENNKEVFPADFGRIAAQTAKQIIMQKIREAERESVYSEFMKKAGDIATGTVHWMDRKRIIVDLGKTEGILPAREQSANDDYRQGDMIKVYVLEVKKTDRGPEVILSRAHAEFVKKLFELEVPEIREGIVEIKAVAREAGSRTKIAVTSTDTKVDCVGSCVGMRGQRVKNVVREVGGEKIDIVRWHEDPEPYIRSALSPAEVAEVRLNREKKSAEIFVQDDQLSLAIGKKGQNVRLACKLTDWALDIKSTSQKIPLSSLKGIGSKTEELLRAANYTSVKDLLKAAPEDLTKIEGIGPKTAQKIIQSAHEAVLGGPPAGSPPPTESSESDMLKEKSSGEGEADAGE